MRADIKLYNQDCMEAMKDMADNAFELAIVDPPYGINIAKGRDGKARWVKREKREWDKEIPTKQYYLELFRISKNQIVWGANYMVEHLPPSMGWVLWDKGQRNFSLADGELAFTSFDKALRVFDFARVKALHEKKDFGERHHPTQKPVALYKWLLQNYAKEGDKILDTHLGSGSIAIACHDLCYDLTGYEIDREYYDNACLRLKRHKAQGQLF